MPRFKLTIEYDGTPYHGFQRQDGFKSVQQALEEAIFQFNRHKVTIFAAGRTDTGVHALGQVVHVDLVGEWKAAKVFEATNALLRLNNETITVLACEAVDDAFDARFSAKARHYLYRISNRFGPPALDRDRVWHIRHPLDHEAMHEAAQVLVGKHDFTTFRSTDCQAKSPLRTLDSLDVVRHGDEIHVTTSSRAFLHNQVRSMVGALKMVGDGKWTKEDVRKSLEARDRKACAAVAPSRGLYFVKVDY